MKLSTNPRPYFTAVVCVYALSLVMNSVSALNSDNERFQSSHFPPFQIELSPSQRLYGHSQIDAVIRDRPQLKPFLTPGSQIYEFLATAFSNPTLNYRLAWKNEPTASGIDTYAQSDPYPAQPDQCAYVRVDGTYIGPGIRPMPRSVDEIMAGLVYEIFNASQGEETARLDCSAIFGTIDRSSYILDQAELEYKAMDPTIAFYNSTWLPFCKSHSIPTVSYRWHLDRGTSFNDYILRFPRTFWYPWTFFGKNFDYYKSLSGPETLSKAQTGDVSSEQKVALLYFRTRDFPDALHWFLKAANGGNAEADRYLGGMYTQGLVLPRDEEQAFNYYQAASRQGDYFAQERLGSIYFKRKDYSNALFWYLKSASQGYPLSEKEAAWMYLYGKGTPRDEKQAFLFTLKASEQGDLRSMQATAHFYKNGIGVAADQLKAKLWLDKCEHANSKESQ